MREERTAGPGDGRASTAATSLHPIPPGTRDVLPDEMRELRAITERLRHSFDEAGYGEVWTPSLEYEEVLRTGDQRAAGARFRLFDGEGQVLALRSDMTIPVARVVATRYQSAPGPLRLCYFAHAYRAVESGTGQQREFLQGGIELIGVDGSEGEAEVIALTLSALDAAGLARHRIGVGDSALYPQLLTDLEVPAEQHRMLIERLAMRDMPGLEALVRRLELPDSVGRLLARLPELRGGPEVLEQVDPAARGAVEGLGRLYATLADRGMADRLILDLGLVRALDYYTGAVYEVYDPAVGFTLGGGGRYDDLIGRFGEPRPACGLALDLQRVHLAQAAEEGLR
jgi:ATP phosphoribosyltransferase regulatory subunit